MKSLTLILSLFLSFSLFANTLELKSNKTNDFRDGIELEFDSSEEFSVFKILGQTYNVKSSSQLITTIMMLQSKQIYASHLYHLNGEALGFRIISNASKP